MIVSNAGDSPKPIGLTDAEIEDVRAHLSRVNAGVFSPEAVEAHLNCWAGWVAAQWEMDVVTPLLTPGARILDIGCGFGSFVLLALDHGFDARGFDAAAFEVGIARRRLSRLRPDLDSEHTFITGDATRLTDTGERFDAITLWNVLEHVPDHRRLIAEASRLLAPGGRMFLICPNYLAWRLEAHYHVPWHPGLRFSRAWAARHIARHGKDPTYFKQGLFYTTNGSVRRALRRADLALYTIDGSLALSPEGWSFRLWRSNGRQILHFLNPFIDSVVLMARRKH
jgi:2-polyprenyl-3-methyl-5-hydroxy-6-metoxy-1,4-benzoquinol methylase